MESSLVLLGASKISINKSDKLYYSMRKAIKISTQRNHDLVVLEHYLINLTFRPFWYYNFDEYNFEQKSNLFLLKKKRKKYYLISCRH